MEMEGEYLPVEIEGEAGQFAFFHITNCINVLDPRNQNGRSSDRSRATRASTTTVLVGSSDPRSGPSGLVKRASLSSLKIMASARIV